MARYSSVVALITWLALAQVARGADPRIGMQDTCDTADGWVAGSRPLEAKEAGAQGPKAITSENGLLVIDTVQGGLGEERLFPDRQVYKNYNMKVGLGATVISKAYGPVDLDLYHYLVANLHSNQTFVLLRVNQHDTKVLYTTGLHVQDISEIPELRGKRPVELSMYITNNTGRIAIDELRLVSELTPEEKAALIPRGFEVRSPGLACHPYQGLEALYDRQRTPIDELRKCDDLAGGPGRGGWAVFRDQATGAPLTRLTRYPGTEDAMQFTANGRFIQVYFGLYPRAGGQGENLYDTQTHQMLALPMALPMGKHYLDPRDGNFTIMLSVDYDKQGTGGHIAAQRHDLRTGQMAVIADQRLDPMPVGGMEAAAFNAQSNRFAIGFRENNIVLIFDPDAPAADRMKVINLPYPIKDLRFVDGDRYLWFAACYTFHIVLYDWRADRELLQPGRLGGGHWAFGPKSILGPYAQVMKLVVPVVDLTDQPGDAIRIHGNYYHSNVMVDYGATSPDGRWAFFDGQKGRGVGAVDLDGQMVDFDLQEPGTVIPIWFHGTSETDWGVKPYVKISPDSTKLVVYSSDMLGGDGGDIYMTTFQRPDPPQDVKVAKTAAGLELTWKSPAQSAETQGYNVYAGTGRTTGFQRVNKDMVTEMRFANAGAKSDSVYLVTSVDNSGLESRFSPQAMLAKRRRDDAVCLFFEAERSDTPVDKAVPFRRQYDGYAGNYGCMRVMPETPDEAGGKLVFTLPADQLHAKGKEPYRVALRAHVRSDIYRDMTGKPAAVDVLIDGKPVGTITPVSGRDWGWTMLPKSFDMDAARHILELRCTTLGVEIDRLAVMSESEAKAAWLKAGNDNTEPEIAATVVEHSGGVTAKADGPYPIELSWPAPAADKFVAYYSAYASAKEPVEAGNATVVGSTDQTRFRDTGLRPGTSLFYRVVGYDSRGRAIVSYSGAGQSAQGPLVFTQRLEVKDAALTQSLELVPDENHPFVRVRKDAGATEPDGIAHYTFEAPAEADYAFWVYNRPRNIRTFTTRGEVDGTAFIFSLPRFINPGHRAEMIYADLTVDRWYLGRMWSRPNAKQNPDGTRDLATPLPVQMVYHLKAGKHTIGIGLSTEANAVRSSELGDIWVTNDLTWQPDDYNARTQFKPDAPADASKH